MNIFHAVAEWFRDLREVHLQRQAFKYHAFVAHRYGERHPELDRYDETTGNDQKWVTIHEIVVDSERDKEQLLAASEYIHYLMELDTDYMGVNYIAHLYESPELIRVRTMVGVSPMAPPAESIREMREQYLKDNPDS